MRDKSTTTSNTLTRYVDATTLSTVGRTTTLGIFPNAACTPCCDIVVVLVVMLKFARNRDAKAAA